MWQCSLSNVFDGKTPFGPGALPGADGDARVVDEAEQARVLERGPFAAPGARNLIGADVFVAAVGGDLDHAVDVALPARAGLRWFRAVVDGQIAGPG